MVASFWVRNGVMLLPLEVIQRRVLAILVAAGSYRRVIAFFRVAPNRAIAYDLCAWR